MSLDRSLKSANALIRHRNVLMRGERLDKLKEQEKWDENKSPLGLPKVAHRKMTLAKAVKEDAPADGAAAGATPAAGAAAPAAAPRGWPGREKRRSRRRQGGRPGEEEVTKPKVTECGVTG